jgi:glycine/D-amino acid oxidase-like deaminating enzyme
MRTRYGVSPWIHEFPASRRPEFPRFRGELSAPVVIVGGGLTGCATAYACAAAGLRPVLLEQDRIGQGASGRSAGLLLPDPGPSFRDFAAAHGLRPARWAFQAWRIGALEGAALIRRLGIKCGLESLDAVVAAIRRGDDKGLRREHEARLAAGLDLTWLNQKQAARTTSLDTVVAAMRMQHAFSIDPYRAAVGLAAAAAKRGAQVFERSVVKRVRSTGNDVELAIDGGTLRAGRVVIATGTATPLFKPLRRHFSAREAYLALTEPLPGTMRRQLADAALTIRDTGVPPRRLRWTRDDRLLLEGGDQPATPARGRDAVLLQRTGDLMYGLLTMYPAISGLQPVYGWEAPYGATSDGLMYIGPHRNYPRHLFALGGPPDSVTGSFLAARVLLRALHNSPDKSDAVFGWSR